MLNWNILKYTCALILLRLFLIWLFFGWTISNSDDYSWCWAKRHKYSKFINFNVLTALVDATNAVKIREPNHKSYEAQLNY